MTDNLADRFEGAVDRQPGHVALDTPDSTVTYEELDREANRFASWLADEGIGEGDVVGIAVGNRIEHVVALIGSFKIRAIPINVNCQYTQTELVDLLSDASAKVLVSEESIGLPEALAGRVVHLTVGRDFDRKLAASSKNRPQVLRSGHDRYILYTGGTTGRPKGVVWLHRDLTVAALRAGDDRNPKGRVLPACPFTHGTAQWTLLGGLLNGSTVVLSQPNGLDAVTLWDRTEQARATRLVIVGDAFAKPMLDALDTYPERWNLSSLVTITSGGARWSERTRLGLLGHLPHVAMVNSFGASETGGQGSQVTFAGQGPEPITGLLRFEPDASSTVIDQDGDEIEPGSGRIGLLARFGPIPQGYLGDPPGSDQVFRFVGGRRCSLPGDLATVDQEGRIVVLGRDRNVINTGGEKVYAEEVEGRLIRHPAVRDAVVVGMPDDRWGEAVTAIVSFDHGRSVDPEALIAHCAQTLARFKVPRRIDVADEIRHLPSGKLDRNWAADTMSQTSDEKGGANAHDRVQPR